MMIEIHQPETEALLQERMASGRFGSVEEVILAALKSSADESRANPAAHAKRQNFAQFLMDSPLQGSGLTFERPIDFPRPADL